MDEGMRRGSDFDKGRESDDCPPDDRALGPAQKVHIKGRCAKCWGPAGLRENDDGICILCPLCGRFVDGQDAQREAESMER